MSRLAYMIGINDYNNWSKLKNPINDMLSFKECLIRNGFVIKDIINSDKNDLADFIYEFELELVDKEVGLLYFAGHGVEINGRQYLIPKDAKKVYGNRTADNSIIETYVDITNFINEISKAKNFTGIIILDCCREQIDKIENTEPTRGAIHDSSTLFSAQQGIFISFSTGPNLTAKDGLGENGLFMKHLKECISEEDVKIEELFKKVRLKVVEESNYEQIPWEHSSLVGDFYFAESFFKKYSCSGDFDIDFIIRDVYEKSLPYSELKTELSSIYENINAQCSSRNIPNYIYMNREEFIKGILSKMDTLYLREKGLLNG